MFLRNIILALAFAAVLVADAAAQTDRADDVKVQGLLIALSEAMTGLSGRAQQAVSIASGQKARADDLEARLKWVLENWVAPKTDHP